MAPALYKLDTLVINRLSMPCCARSCGAQSQAGAGAAAGPNTSGQQEHLKSAFHRMPARISSPLRYRD
jgi:hypothetical protein